MIPGQTSLLSSALSIVWSEVGEARLSLAEWDIHRSIEDVIIKTENLKTLMGIKQRVISPAPFCYLR